jgi:general secretion pathway protein I
VLTTPRFQTRLRSGLSLLEVLVAMTIFLMSVVAIASLVDFGADRSMAASMTTLGTRLAQSKLAEIEAGLIAPNSSENGTFEDEPDWNYSLEPGAELAASTYPVTIRVWREAGGRTYEVTLTQIIFDPAQQGKAGPATKPTASDTTGGM